MSCYFCVKPDDVEYVTHFVLQCIHLQRTRQAVFMLKHASDAYYTVLQYTCEHCVCQLYNFTNGGKGSLLEC